jgi:membrane-bound lytic murein transglycosylase B
MSRPAEAKPWRDYRPIFIQPKRIDGGRAFLATMPRCAAARRGQARRAEGNHRRHPRRGNQLRRQQGQLPVVDALYTLAFAYPRTGDPAKARAREPARGVLPRRTGAAVRAGAGTGLDIATLKGSYAGAMGWGQFMPSSYRDYAVDGDGDGRVDLFNDLDDVFASVANYFEKKGKWERGGPVMQAAVRDASAADFVNPGNAVTLDQSLASLAAAGYRPAAAPLATGPVTLVTLEGVAGPEYWIVYNNFKAITTYNISRLYATAVYQLSQSIAGRAPAAP